MSEDGPRTDVSDVTTYTGYNAHGQPLSITDPNGLVTTLTYDTRQRLKTRTVGSEVTTFDYWPTGRVVANHIDALARSRRIDFAELLGRLTRDEFKGVCEALGLATDGREKQLLIDRVLSSALGVMPAESSKANGKAPPSALDLQVDVDPDKKLSREQLERYLWAAADILRGQIDSGDYKNYIFGLLFLKRLSDRFDEECEALVKEGINPEEKDEHQFFVPKRARWSQIQKAATDLGDVLNDAWVVYDSSGERPVATQWSENP